ncbi:MAG: AMP-binding protein, partial [Candidatus Marinimicrobia bacterium]|nr:AMP-binding protein [Candidatus Neomarinimicrobiota bacterium]MCF7902850.1 AMP-binding protein [Candidatus Neomarinimicrobiota bacterium]
KAVVHTLGNHYYSALGSNENIPLSPGDRWQLALPLYHVSGMGIVFRSVVAGSAIVISNELTVKSLLENRVTHLSLVSTQFKRLLAMEEAEKLQSQLRAILLGGGPIPRKLIQQGKALNLPVFTSYGLSEMTSQVATTTPNQSDLSSARVLPYREVKISSEGEILVRGATLFAGYLQENGIDPSRDEQGWFHTRDSGTLDENYLQVTGRLDNQFISGGENIQPEIIERALLDSGDIDSAIVVPVPDEEFGQRPFAFYASTHPIHPEEISIALRKILPAYMLPVQFTPLPEEFRTDLKPSRQKLRDLAVEIFAPKL